MTTAVVFGPESELRAAMAAAIARNGVAVRETADFAPLEPDERWVPLTLNLPAGLEVPERSLFDRCGEVDGLRQWVQVNLGYGAGAAQLWLPLIYTARGLLYGEAITGSLPYRQPVQLSDRQRQPLYQMARPILSYLSAPPAVYLLGASYRGDTWLFDRLWPFPAAPALGGTQQPDLFTCHWYCLTGQPIRDALIARDVAYQTLA
jgi:hypothetical protein